MGKRTLSTLKILTKNGADPVVPKATRGCIRVHGEILADHVILRCINCVNKTFTVGEGMHELVIAREDTIEKTIHDGIIEDDSNIITERPC